MPPSFPLALALLAAHPGGVYVQPGTARPGDAVLIRVLGAAEEPSGTLGEADLDFVPAGDQFLALVPLGVEHKLGPLAFSVRMVSEGQERDIDGTLEVVDPDFPARELAVSKKFTSPDKAARRRMKEDQRAFDRAFGQPLAPPGFRENFDWPRNAVTTAPFGDLRLFNGKKKSQHFGMDLDGDTGDPTWAANDGEVVMARSCFGSGNTVLLHHGLSLYTAYFHLSKMDVKVGQQVRRGQALGKVGKTGRVTGPHLHFGAKLAGKWVDPASVLRLDFGLAPPAVSGPSTKAGASRETR